MCDSIDEAKEYLEERQVGVESLVLIERLVRDCVNLQAEVREERGFRERANCVNEALRAENSKLRELVSDKSVKARSEEIERLRGLTTALYKALNHALETGGSSEGFEGVAEMARILK